MLELTKGCLLRSLAVLCLVGLPAIIAFAQVTDEIPELRLDTSQDLGQDFGFDVGELEDVSAPDFNANATTPEQAAQEAELERAMLFGGLIMGLLALVLLGVAAYLLSDALKAIPLEFRKLPHWVPWLLLVPLVNIVVFVLSFIMVPKSMANYLASRGDTSMGDCGASNGLWGVILYLLGCTFPIGLVLLVMCLLKVNQAKKIARTSEGVFSRAL